MSSLGQVSRTFHLGWARNPGERSTRPTPSRAPSVSYGVSRPRNVLALFSEEQHPLLRRLRSICLLGVSHRPSDSPTILEKRQLWTIKSWVTKVPVSRKSEFRAGHNSIQTKHQETRTCHTHSSSDPHLCPVPPSSRMCPFTEATETPGTHSAPSCGKWSGFYPSGRNLERRLKKTQSSCGRVELQGPVRSSRAHSIAKNAWGTSHVLGTLLPWVLLKHSDHRNRAAIQPSRKTTRQFHWPKAPSTYATKIQASINGCTFLLPKQWL